ncbi:MAG: hypothetical protein ACYDHH_32930 [Solirubrobacteraceae bacterium]
MPFIVAGVLLTVLKPVTAPVAVILLAHAWLIPELYASRGANVMRQKQATDATAEQVSAILLSSLLAADATALYEQTGVVIQRGELGVWLLSEAGAVLVRPGGRRVICYCVKASGTDLPRADRITHLLLALRSDEVGFATLANLSFSGATWRLRRRLEARIRPALSEAVAAARE